MILVFAAGLWAILRVGNRLKPAKNLAGEWQVTWSKADPQLPVQMTIAQSGKFLNATLHDADHPRGVHLAGLLEDAGTKLSLKAAKPEIALTARPDASGQRLLGRVEGGSPSVWQAVRLALPSR